MAKVTADLADPARIWPRAYRGNAAAWNPQFHHLHPRAASASQHHSGGFFIDVKTCYSKALVEPWRM